jgi:DNA-binding transcriptional LysR family regulator
LDWLRTFLAVVDRGGFTAAAEQVHRSQSRVSAHIAALERELGVTLLERTRRPVQVTHAGEVLAEHAREILAAIGSARSAVGAARGLDEGRLTLLTTPCLGTAFLPAALAKLAAAHPGVRFEVLEDGRHDVERRFLDDGVALAVLPTLTAPAAPGLRERVLWSEPLRAVVPADHRFARDGGSVSVDELVREPLVVAGASGDAMPEVLDLLARRGVVASVAATADCPDTVAALAAGAGDALVTVPLADPDLRRTVAAYWYDVLLGTELGRALHAEVLGAAPPEGAVGLPDDDLRASRGPILIDPTSHVGAHGGGRR